MKSFEDKNEDEIEIWDFKQVPLSESYPYEVPGVGVDCGRHDFDGFKMCQDCGNKTFYYKHCTDVHCPTCSFASLNRQAKKSADKIRGYSEWVANNRGSGMKVPRHIVFSPKSWSEGEMRSPEDLKKEWKAYFDYKKNNSDMFKYSKDMQKYCEYLDRGYFTDIEKRGNQYRYVKVYEEPEEPIKPLSEVLKGLEGVCVLHTFRIKGYDRVSGYVSTEMFNSDDNIKRRLREYRKKSDDNRGFWELVKADVLHLGSWRAYVYYSPHIHFFGFGRIPLKSDVFQERYGIVYKNLQGRSFTMEPKENDFGYTNEVQRTLVYLGSHATITPRDEEKKIQRIELFFGVGAFTRGRLENTKELSVNESLSDVCFNPECSRFHDEKHSKVISGHKVGFENLYRNEGKETVIVKHRKGANSELLEVDVGREYQSDDNESSWFRYSFEQDEEGVEKLCRVEKAITFIKWHKWVPRVKLNAKPTKSDEIIYESFENSLEEVKEPEIKKDNNTYFENLVSYYLDIGDLERAFAYSQILNSRNREKLKLDNLIEKGCLEGVSG